MAGTEIIPYVFYRDVAAALESRAPRTPHRPDKGGYADCPPSWRRN
jgi:hypothetical protein